MRNLIILGIGIGAALIVANSATVNITRPDNGIMRIQGATSEWTASDFDEFKVEPTGSAMVNKHEKSIILKPDLVMRDMAESHIDGAGTIILPEASEDIYEFRKPPYREGADDKFTRLWTNDANSIYILEGSETLESNQGLMVKFRPQEYAGDMKWSDFLAGQDESLLFNFAILSELTASGESNNFSFNLYPDRIDITHSVFGKIEDAFPPETKEYINNWGINISDHFNLKLSDMDVVTMVVFFNSSKIYIGIDGVDNLVSFTPVVTINDMVMPFGGVPSFMFRGQAQLAWQPLTFAPESHIETPVYESLYRLNAPRAELIKGNEPQGTSISVSGEARAIGQEEDLPRSEYLAECDLKGDGVRTPSLYRFRMVDPVVRDNAGEQTGTLTGDVDEIQLMERINDTGEYSGGDMAIRLTNVPERSLITQNAKINTVVTVSEGLETPAELTLNGYYVDVNSITRPAYNMINLSVHASPITKRLEITPILESMSYDHLGLTHIELVKELCELAGVEMAHDADENAITLPVSPDMDAPNWQFQRGSTVWQALQTVREYSGWLMYPKNNVLQYRKFPAGATTGTALNMNDDAFTEIQYIYADNYRTRFLVIGEDKDGNSIFHVGRNDTIENTIGESRPAVIIDPRISSLQACEAMVDGLMDYYTTQHLYATFNVQRFERYPNLWIGDVIQIADDKVSVVNNKYFMITSLNLNVQQFTCTATIEARSLWT